MTPSPSRHSPASGHVIVIGAGIVGLAHAWAAARRGHRVTLFERDSRAKGASVRNFGLFWPFTMPPGDLRQLALESRRHWLELADRANIWLEPTGSLHLAHHDDEWAVLNEFFDHAKSLGLDCELLTPRQVRERSRGVIEAGLLGGLFSPTECSLDPRQALAQIPLWLAETFDVTLHFDETVLEVDPPKIRSSRGKTYEADRIFVCSGVDFETLYPEQFEAAGLQKCKLQMMRTEPQPNGWRLGPPLAAGLSLSRYPAFDVCPSVTALRHRINRQMPEYVRHGIHVMAAQNQRGEVLLGDSHEYGDVDPFDKPAIDDLILNQARRMIDLPDWRIAARWHGIYAKHPTKPYLHLDPQPCVTIVSATGGSGMTLSFALAEQLCARLDEPKA